MIVTAATLPGTSTVPNEDWYAVTPRQIIVLDGATARTDTGCSHGVAWYTEQLGTALLAADATAGTTLRGALRTAIRTVNALHPECDLTHPGTPSAGIGLVRFDEDTVRYLVLGDVSVCVETGTGIEVLSDDRVSHTAADLRREADRHPIGSDLKRRALLAMKHGELAARNTTGGYWIAATDPGAADHAYIAEAKLADITRLALLTDGATRAITFGLHTWPTALDLIERDGADQLLHQVRAAEATDPLGLTHHRNKASDDATAVLVTLIPPHERTITQVGQ